MAVGSGHRIVQRTVNGNVRSSSEVWRADGGTNGVHQRWSVQEWWTRSGVQLLMHLSHKGRNAWIETPVH